VADRECPVVVCLAAVPPGGLLVIPLVVRRAEAHPVAECRVECPEVRLVAAHPVAECRVECLAVRPGDLLAVPLVPLVPLVRLVVRQVAGPRVDPETGPRVCKAWVLRAAAPEVVVLAANALTVA